MLVEQKKKYLITSKMENLMDKISRYRFKTNPIFLVVDEFAAQEFSWDSKKEFNETNDSLKELFWMGRFANVHLLMAQRAEISVIDGAIRDNL